MRRMVKWGSLGGVLLNTLARLAIYVGSIPALGAICLISMTPNGINRLRNHFMMGIRIASPTSRFTVSHLQGFTSSECFPDWFEGIKTKGADGFTSTLLIYTKYFWCLHVCSASISIPVHKYFDVHHGIYSFNLTYSRYTYVFDFSSHTLYFVVVFWHII